MYEEDRLKIKKRGFGSLLDLAMSVEVLRELYLLYVDR